MLGVLGRRSGSPRDVARDLFHSTLFDGGTYASPIMGDIRSIGSITVDDLKEHHQRFYSPENTILTIVSSQPVGEVMNWVSNRFGQLESPSLEPLAPTPPAPINEVKSAHQEMDKEQTSIYIGGTLPGASSDEAVALSVATNILSTRLYLTLSRSRSKI